MFSTHCFAFFCFYLKKMELNQFQQPLLASQLKLIMIKRNSCGHHLLEVGRWLLLKRPRSETRLLSREKKISLWIALNGLHPICWRLSYQSTFTIGSTRDCLLDVSKLPFFFFCWIIFLLFHHSIVWFVGVKNLELENSLL